MAQLASWVIPLGFAAGYLFNLLTDIEIVSWLPEVGNHILGGFFAADAGVFGAFVTGTLSGKYLIIAKGTDAFIQEATQLLRQYGPENLQGHVETTRA